VATQFLSAIRIQPNYAEAHNKLGVEFAKQGLYEEAATELDAALDIELGNAIYHYNYAVLVLELGDIDLARQHLKEVLSIDPEHKGAHLTLDSIESGKSGRQD